jgi:TolB protein
MNVSDCRAVAIGLALSLSAGRGLAVEGGLGLFEAHADVGTVGKPGTAVYDAKAGTYTVTGGGENMWFATDAFHFVWKKATGDVTLAADVRLVGSGGNAHRKAALLIRQGLEPDAAYADAVVHGDGLTSIQYREVRGGATREIQSRVRGPLRLRIEKQGEYVSLSVAAAGEPLGSAGGEFKIRFAEPFLVGLGVCAHDDAVSETAVFSNVEISTGKASAKGERMLESTLETIAIDSKDRKVVHHVRDHIEAPNWSRDGKELLFNSAGLLFALPVAGGVPRRIDSGFATRCNNDHGLSPDGTLLAISDESQGDGRSLVYVLPAAGGTPRLVTPVGPSYWHGWSPDGKTLAYCAERGGEYDVYTMPVGGGEETRLTSTPGLDDGPDYSADGQWVYFNSERTGTMQIWRMRTDGTGAEQLTSDGFNDWFPHPSPDGKWVAFLSYEKGVKGHPPNQDVMIRLMPADGGPTQVLAKLFGGQGTINVPSWSPDSTSLAFVSYRLAQP